MRYSPEPSVTVERVFSISAGLDVSTVTPGSTAPDESLTTPVIDAWANTSVGNRTRHASMPAVFNTLSTSTLLPRQAGHLRTSKPIVRADRVSTNGSGDRRKKFDAIRDFGLPEGELPGARQQKYYESDDSLTKMRRTNIYGAAGTA